MYISSIKLLKEYRGLKKINMTGLGHTVILVGPNGSGKTRLLKLLAREIIAGKKDILEYSFLGNTSESQKLVADYSSYESELQLPEKFPPFVISSASDRLKSCNFEQTKKDALLFIWDLAMRGGAEFDAFNELLKGFIGQSVIFIDNIPTVFGLEFSEMELSPGQQYLLRMCVALHCNNKNEASVIILDEPEVHLHPKVLIAVLKKIQADFSETQIWIATHSVSLLPMFDSKDIWYMESGCAYTVGSNSEKVMNGLIGDEENCFLLRQFVALPEVYAYNRFAYESLLKPEAMLCQKKDDPQVKAVINSLKSIQAKTNICVVDYGVGKGRLLEALSFEEEFLKMKYYAYDKYEDDKATCEEVIRRCASGDVKYTNDIDKLKEILSDTVDAVFLVNVLHEIDPAYWKEVIQNIYDLLNNDGLLILVEIEEFSYGEKPYRNGFLVLQEESLGCLLGGWYVEPYRDLKRPELVSYRIHKEFLKNVSDETILEALKSLKQQSYEEIKKIRSKELPAPSFKDGVRHGFWTQQFANAVLSIDQLEGHTRRE